MKTNVLRITMLCAIALCIINTPSYSQDDALKKMVGKWTYKFNVPNRGEIEGKCTITLVNGEVKAILPMLRRRGNDNANGNTNENRPETIETSALTLVNGKYAGKVNFRNNVEIQYLFSWKAGTDSLLMERISNREGEQRAMPPVAMTREKEN